MKITLAGTLLILPWENIAAFAEAVRGEL